MGRMKRSYSYWNMAALLLLALPIATGSSAQAQDQPQQQNAAKPAENTPPSASKPAEAEKPAERNAPATAQPAQQNAERQNSGQSPSTNIAELMKDDRQWPMAAKNYSNTRFSKLDKINKSNVENLQLAWSFSLGAPRGQEAAPLAINGTIYVVGPYFGPHPNQVFALDMKSGDLKWSYAPKPDPAAVGVACCDVVTRGLAYDNGKIFLNTLDDYSVAIDAETGKELWHTKLGDINTGETITMAPIVVKGKVLVGNSGGEMGVRGWLTALDENTGKIVWRGYST
ncbi:MAG TPA: PQQ-binding-like beta-propeller repeat protein, partial [Lacipirellulaceae bacterium]|nr:PQQ-binding-like beta-propeller repeat protein [Lacipirellulaceae bacterium]